MMIEIKNKDKITLDFGVNNYMVYPMYVVCCLGIYVFLYLNMNFRVIIFTFNINTSLL